MNHEETRAHVSKVLEELRGQHGSLGDNLITESNRVVNLTYKAFEALIITIKKLSCPELEAIILDASVESLDLVKEFLRKNLRSKEVLGLDFDLEVADCNIDEGEIQ